MKSCFAHWIVLLLVTWCAVCASTAFAADSGVEGMASLRGELVPGVVVLAFKDAGPGPEAAPLAVSSGTDAKGLYRMSLQPGSYHLVAVRSAGPPWPFKGEPGDLFCYYLGNPIVVEPGKLTRVGFNMVKIAASPAPVRGDVAGISGRVLFEDKPLGRAYVYVYKDSGSNFHGMGLASMPTDDEGRFRVKLPPGRYYVLARKRQGGGMYGPPGKDDYIGYLPGNPIEVRAGALSRVELETTTRIDLLEQKYFTEGGSAGWFEGDVAESAGKPAAGLYVLFYADETMSGTPAFVAGPTDGKGHFRVRAAAGTFHLLARSNLGGPLEAGEWYGKVVLPASGVPAGGIRIRVSRFQGQ